MFKKSITRIYKAFGYSRKGLVAAFKHETAFREETLLLIIAVIISLALNISALGKIVLIGSVLFMMIVELLNSAIEAVVDRIGSEHHELSGRAKDMGSASVLLASILVFATWSYVIIGYFLSL